jgi:threonine/homoserine/homoserine lactone efflux protein
MAGYAQELAAFLVQAAVVSLTGVMAPGAMTAAALAAGTRLRHGGALMAVGHGIVEFPLMFLILAGVGPLLASPAARIVVGLAGGAMLIVTAILMFISLKGAAQSASSSRPTKGPILTGVILTGGNPLFLAWWATVGLALAAGAARLGVLAFALFAVIHWLCDLLYLEFLTLATFKGAKLLGDRAMRWVQGGCALAVLVIGGKFLVDAAISLAG